MTSCKDLFIFISAASFTSQSSNQLQLCSTTKVITANQERVSFDVTFESVRGSEPGSGAVSRRVLSVCRNNGVVYVVKVFLILIMDSVSGSSSAAGTVQLKCVCELTAFLMFVYVYLIYLCT